ncbi:hypothetical protein LLH23_15960 [bacterium]|nr:hypothetical protein [bacterium]
MSRIESVLVVLAALTAMWAVPAAAAETPLGPLPDNLLSDDGTVFPARVAVDGGGFVLVSDLSNRTLWRVSDDGRHLAAIAALPGGKYSVWLDGRLGLAYDAIKDLAFSPHAGIVSYAARKGAQWVVVVDGQESPPYDEPSLNHHFRVYSEDGRQVAVPVQRGGQWTMLRNARPVDQPVAGVDEACAEFSTDGYRRVVGSCRALFSPDGKRLAYVALRGKQACVVVDGHEGPAYDGVSLLSFSANGARLGYAGQRGERQVVCLGERVSPAYDAVEELVFSPDGAHYAYAATRGEASMVVRDGKAGPAYPSVGNLVFSPDGLHLTYLATRDDKSCVVSDGKPGPWFPEIGMAYASSGLLPTFSADSKQLAYPVTEENGYRLVVNGRVDPLFAQVDVPYPIFTPAGHVIYLATGADDRQCVVVDGRPGPWHERAQHLTLSPDGRRYAYVVWEGNQERVVLDGQAQPLHDRVFGLQFSADSRQFAYGAETNDQASVIRGAEATLVPANDILGLRFTPDLAHWACTGTLDNDKHALVVDGRLAGVCEQVTPGPVTLTEDGRAEALGVRAGALVRLSN